MKVLLDTCAFLWIVTGDARLSDRARDVFRDPENEAFLSAVSTWEITVKHGLGRLPLPESPETYVPALRKKHEIAPLPLSEEATQYLGRLPALHRDPVDRMLVCQSIVEGLLLLTPDESITRYPVHSDLVVRLAPLTGTLVSLAATLPPEPGRAKLRTLMKKQGSRHGEGYSTAVKS